MVKIVLVLFFIFAFFAILISQIFFMEYHNSDEYKNKKAINKWNKIKEQNKNDGQINGIYIYGLDDFISTEDSILALKDNDLKIINNQNIEYKLSISKIKNIKILDKSELKNSAIAISLGVVSSLFQNKETRKYLVIIYDKEELNGTLIFDITDSESSDLFYKEILNKCSISVSKEL